jgi:uncharacterized protein (TIGR03118 family)
MPDKIFKKIQLTSDQLNVGAYQDPNLIGAWGFTIVDNTVWIASIGLISNYDISGKLLYNVVIPQVQGNAVQATGIIENRTSGFIITNGPNSASANILVASTNGAIFGYNPLVDPENCILVVDNSLSASVYTGLTITRNYLCVTDYFNNKIAVFDFNFIPSNALPFTDLEVLNPLPDNVAPYNIVRIDGLLYVVYAVQTDSSGTVASNVHSSYVSVFNKKGLFIKRLISKHHSNSWAFIKFDKDFLLGNFDGSISIYGKHGKKLGYIMDMCGKMIIYGLYGLNVHKRNIYFSASPSSNFVANLAPVYHGLYGVLVVC